MKLLHQIQRHLLAIISLMVAIAALGYNTVRNELTEENRTIRYAGFELLKELNELQLLVDYAHFDMDASKGNPIMGWGHIMYVKDMSLLISDDMVAGAEQLGQLWSMEWQSVHDDEASNGRVTRGINQLRGEVRGTLRGLE